MVKELSDTDTDSLKITGTRCKRMMFHCSGFHYQQLNHLFPSITQNGLVFLHHIQFVLDMCSKRV